MTNVVFISPAGKVEVEVMDLSGVREFRRMEMVSPREVKEVVYKCVYQNDNVCVLVGEW